MSCGEAIIDELRITVPIFGDFDPFGNFDLLFGAARLNLKIMEVPIRYRARRYGETQISRLNHGWLWARMVLFARRKREAF